MFLKLWTDIHGSQKTSITDFGDPLTFHLVPPRSCGSEGGGGVELTVSVVKDTLDIISFVKNLMTFKIDRTPTSIEVWWYLYKRE